MNPILIAAGHDNKATGAIAGSVREADLALDLRNLVCEYLALDNIPFLTDGAGAVNLPLPKSIELAKGCGLAIEIHFNSVVDRNARGTEAISLPKLKPFAQRLAAAVAGVLNSKLRGEAGWIDQTKSQHTRLGFVADGGGIILEVCFMSNPIELANYQSMRRLIARTIADLIASYYRGEK